ncbi:MAG: hypothetical protein ACC669_08715 [bacterium]
MDSNDKVRVRHMLDAALEAQSFLSKRTREDLDVNRMLVLAILKQALLTVDEFKALRPDLHLVIQGSAG